MPNQQRIALLKQFIKDEPGNPFNKYALAMEYYNDEPEESLKLLHDLLLAFPDYLPTYYKTAHLHWNKGQLEKAAEIFNEGIRIATTQHDQKAISELKSSYTNLQFEME